MLPILLVGIINNLACRALQQLCIEIRPPAPFFNDVMKFGALSLPTALPVSWTYQVGYHQ